MQSADFEVCGCMYIVDFSTLPLRPKNEGERHEEHQQMKNPLTKRPSCYRQPSKPHAEHTAGSGDMATIQESNGDGDGDEDE